MTCKVDGADFKTVGIKRLKLPSLTLCKFDTLPGGYLCSIFILQGETVVILSDFAASVMDYSCLYHLRYYFLTFF